MDAFLTRDMIFAASDIEIEKVEVPQWGGFVYVKSLSAAERDEFEAHTVVQRGKEVELNRRNFRAKLVSLTVVDQDGKRLFGEPDVRKLGEKSAAAMDVLFAAAARLSGISQADEDDLVKNSGSDRSGDSSSG